jgi:hypothetical protein
MAPLNSERQGALRLLAKAPNGCAEALMLAHGSTAELLDHWWSRASRRPNDTACGAGRRRIEATWLMITDAVWRTIGI